MMGSKMKPINEREKRKIIKGLLSMLKVEETRLTQAVSEHNSNSVLYINKQMERLANEISKRYIDPLEINNSHSQAFYEKVDNVLIRCGIRKGYYRKQRAQRKEDE